MSRQTVEERLAHIEAGIKAHGNLDDLRFAQMANLDKKLDKIDEELSRYRGFVGGILLVTTAIVTFIKLFSDDIARFFSK